jgi:hypothetical protein
MHFLKGALFLALATTSPVADDWPAARVKNVFSDDGSRFVRITPGNNLEATVGFKGASTGRNSRGEFYVRQRDRSYKLIADVALPNPIAPVEALMNNDGLLITFDNWHNVGYGKVVVIYDATGAVVRAYDLDQLYPREKLGRVPTSVSSRWWRCAQLGYVDSQEQRHVHVPEFSGGSFVFDLQTGRFTYTTGTAPCRPPAGPLSVTGR